MVKVFIDGRNLSTKDVVVVAHDHVKVEIPQKVKQKVQRCRQVLEDIIKEKKMVYGVTTGFGALGSITISPERIKELQTNLIRSHSAGIGKALDEDVTRALMLLRANTLAKGNSGIRLEVLETLVQMINNRVHPIIPEKGSVGASGDLAPLSHMTLVMIGEGEAEYKGEKMSGKEAMRKAGIPTVELNSKEGIALNNGTQMMTAIAVLALHDAERLVEAAEIAASLSLEALNGISDAFDERIHQARPHFGQITSAQNVRSMISNSKIVKSSEEVITNNETRPPQDPLQFKVHPSGSRGG